MAVAVHTLRGATGSLPRAWGTRMRWRLAVPIVGASLLTGVVATTAATHPAEVALAFDAGRSTLVETGAWLSTTTAQAFTMHCAHARGG
jgi:hypothetical protein